MPENTMLDLLLYLQFDGDWLRRPRATPMRLAVRAAQHYPKEEFGLYLDRQCMLDEESLQKLEQRFYRATFLDRHTLSAITPPIPGGIMLKAAQLQQHQAQAAQQLQEAEAAQQAALRVGNLPPVMEEGEEGSQQPQQGQQGMAIVPYNPAGAVAPPWPGQEGYSGMPPLPLPTNAGYDWAGAGALPPGAAVMPMPADGWGGLGQDGVGGFGAFSGQPSSMMPGASSYGPGGGARPGMNPYSQALGQQQPGQGEGRYDPGGLAPAGQQQQEQPQMVPDPNNPGQMMWAPHPPPGQPPPEQWVQVPDPNNPGQAMWVQQQPQQQEQWVQVPDPSNPGQMMWAPALGSPHPHEAPRASNVPEWFDEHGLMRYVPNPTKVSWGWV